MTVTIDGGQAATIFLILLRCTGLVFAAPILGHHSVPTLVKFGLAGALSVALMRTTTVAASPLPLIVAAPIELVIGLALGWILNLGFHGIELAGRLISIQLGLSLGEVFSPTQDNQTTALDPFFSVLAGLLFLAMGLHLAIIRALASSFAVYPLGAGLPAGLASTGMQTTALVLELGVRVALPLALALLLIELAVALLARAIPQINVFILGLPLKMIVGVALLSMALPSLLAGGAAIYRFLFSAATGGQVSV